MTISGHKLDGVVLPYEKGQILKDNKSNKNEKTKEYKPTRSFRALQARSDKLFNKESQLYQRGYKGLSRMQKDNLGAIYERLFSRNNGTGYSFRSNLTSEEKGTTFRIGEESPKTDGGQNGRKSANIEVKSQKSAKIDLIINA